MVRHRRLEQVERPTDVQVPEIGLGVVAQVDAVPRWGVHDEVHPFRCARERVPIPHVQSDELVTRLQRGRIRESQLVPALQPLHQSRAQVTARAGDQYPHLFCSLWLLADH